MPLETLMAHIVTCGHPMFSVFPATSIILLFLTIVRTIFGLFHFTLNITPFTLHQIFFAYEKTQFSCTIKSIMCNNGRIRQRLFAPPPTYSTCAPQKHFPLPPRILPSSACPSGPLTPMCFWVQMLSKPSSHSHS
jgi:hypothetical protein